jgi:hypothetical protein
MYHGTIIVKFGLHTKAAGEAPSIRTWPLQEIALRLRTCTGTTCRLLRAHRGLSCALVLA